jgi:hypothetical protein
LSIISLGIPSLTIVFFIFLGYGNAIMI